MITAALASLAVWCAIPASPVGRQRALFDVPRPSRRPSPALVAAAVTPVAALMLLGWPLGVLLGIALSPAAHGVVSRLESAAARERTA
jgi:hypothetical protein